MTTTQKGSELVRQSSDMEAVGILEAALLDGIAPDAVERDPDDVSKEIIAQLLAAEDDEQLERLEAEGWGEYVGHPFEIHGFVWRPSTYDEGQAIFLVVRVTSLVDGAPHVLTTGSGQVMAQLVNLAKRGRFPVVRELAGAETKQKNTVYWLKTPDELAKARREAARAAAAEEAGDAGTDGGTDA